MSDAPEIRLAVPADAETIYQFICELADYERDPNAVCTSPQVLQEQMSSASPPFECLLAELAGRPVGFALFFHNYSTWKGRQGIHLEDLYVEPSYRNFGIGKALFCAVAKLANSRQCARMEWAALNWNTPAIDFYRTFQAEPLEEWTLFRLSGDALKQLG